jgi:hypothetical protein
MRNEYICCMCGKKIESADLKKSCIIENFDDTGRYFAFCYGCENQNIKDFLHYLEDEYGYK